MAQLTFKTKIRNIKERHTRLMWLRERIPSEEFFIAIPPSEDEDGYDLDDEIQSVVTIWADDADKIITEFWFRFP